jgi:hypothetical protein
MTPGEFKRYKSPQIIVIASTHQGSSPKQIGMTFWCYFELD